MLSKQNPIFLMTTKLKNKFYEIFLILKEILDISLKNSNKKELKQIFLTTFLKKST